MSWLQLHVPASIDRVDSLQEALDFLGAVAVTVTDAADQPLLEPPPGATPLWNESIISALFELPQQAQPLIDYLVSQQGCDPDDIKVETVQDQPWERAWMDDFQPMRFGQRLWIVPSWAEAPDPTAANLKLDPGLAFGTGTHETTALCLEWLDGAEVAGKSMLDFGCGSGVLAIAALLLGAEQAVGCDLDPQALLASRDNAERNGVTEKLVLTLPENMPQQQFPLVIANILAGPLVELAPLLTNHCSLGGDLVLSGILADQTEAVLDAYREHFTLSPVAEKNGWVRIHGIRQR